MANKKLPPVASLTGSNGEETVPNSAPDTLKAPPETAARRQDRKPRSSAASSPEAGGDSTKPSEACSASPPRGRPERGSTGTTLTIDLPADVLAAFEVRARRNGASVEDLVLATLRARDRRLARRPPGRRGARRNQALLACFLLLVARS